MPKIDPWRLDPARYPHRVAIQTRFQDVDMLGHLNNVAMAALFETARVRFNHRLGLGEWRGYRWLVARIAIDYLAEGYHPADVEIGTGIGRMGNRSWQLLAAAWQNDRPIAICEAVLVMEAKQDETSLPGSFRERLAQFQVRGT
ncbi:MAG TPA: acyl-CoA thioesterase [Sphingomonas sp.]|jgi:acyl-CoA thioester hydrolase